MKNIILISIFLLSFIFTMKGQKDSVLHIIIGEEQDKRTLTEQINNPIGLDTSGTHKKDSLKISLVKPSGQFEIPKLKPKINAIERVLYSSSSSSGTMLVCTNFEVGGTSYRNTALGRRKMASFFYSEPESSKYYKRYRVARIVQLVSTATVISMAAAYASDAMPAIGAASVSTVAIIATYSCIFVRQKSFRKAVNSYNKKNGGVYNYNDFW